MIFLVRDKVEIMKIQDKLRAMRILYLFPTFEFIHFYQNDVPDHVFKYFCEHLLLEMFKLLISGLYIYLMLDILVM